MECHSVSMECLYSATWCYTNYKFVTYLEPSDLEKTKNQITRFLRLAKSHDQDRGT